MTKTILRNARCIDPASGLDDTRDIICCPAKGGTIAAIGEHLELKGEGRSATDDVDEFDCTGKIIVPGLFDMHVHLREPGYEYKEDIASGAAAAAAGGFTGILAMPNTNPVCDTGSRVSHVLDKGVEAGGAQVFAAGACTTGLKGEALAEMGDMSSQGAVAFTDDGRGVQNAGMMRRVMDYAVQFGHPVLSHCECEAMSKPGVVNEGVVSTRLGMAGWPALAEEEQIARDIELCELTGCALHIQHLTTARGVELVDAAKAKGLPVTCEVTPHHLFLCEEDIDTTYNTNLKMNPPLRTRADMEALQQAVCEGRIDCIATDHAPHAAHEKALEFELAPFGTTGLETALALVLTHLVAPGKMSWQRLVECMAIAPRRILGIEQVSLADTPGKPGHDVGRANFTVIDPAQAWTVDAAGFVSKAKNSAFIGQELTGKAVMTFVGGKRVY
jgi:dihydroorotase